MLLKVTPASSLVHYTSLVGTVLCSVIGVLTEVKRQIHASSGKLTKGFFYPVAILSCFDICIVIPVRNWTSGLNHALAMANRCLLPLW